LAFYKPTTIHFEQEEKALRLSQLPDNLMASPAVFNNSLALISLRMDDIKNNQFKISCLWKSNSSANLQYKVAIHFLNKNGNIVGMAHYVESAKELRVDKGRYWNESIIIPAPRTKGMNKIAIVLFERNANTMANLYTVQGTQSDWNHHRLIVPLHKDLK
jgi:hypothetical protein